MKPLLLMLAIAGLTGGAALAAQAPAATPAPTAPLPPLPPLTTPIAQESAPLGPPLSGAALERAAEEVSALMRCPVCQGLSVADSPATSAVDLKKEVRRLMALGYTQDQVIATFERSYGEFIRLEPKAEGFNWLVWLLPIAALAVGAGIIFMRLRPERPAAPVSREGSSSS